MSCETIRKNATRFCLWRIAKSVDFKCSPQELAEEAGVTLATVYNHLAEVKWSLKYDPAVGSGRLTNEERFFRG